jgi:hypothetical protein
MRVDYGRHFRSALVDQAVKRGFRRRGTVAGADGTIGPDYDDVVFLD